MNKKILCAILIILVLVVIIFIICIKLENSADTDTGIEYVKEAGIEYDVSQLDNLEFQLTNIPNELKEENISQEDLTIKIKEFLYKNGMITATVGEILSCEINDTNIVLVIKLNDNENTEIRVTIARN